MPQHILPGETAPKAIVYESSQSLSAATIQVGLSPSYLIPPASWESSSPAVDMSQAATGTITAYIANWSTRPVGLQWAWIQVTLSGSIDEAVAVGSIYVDPPMGIAMSAYSTADMVLSLLLPSGTTNGSLAHGVSDDRLDLIVNDAISEADSTINLYLSAYYLVPVALAADGAPAPLPTWSRNIAAYLAALTLRGSKDFTDNDPIARRYRATIAELVAVQSGKSTLPFPTQTGDSSTFGSAPPVNPYVGSLFTPQDFNLGYYPSNYPGFNGRW